MGRWLAAFTMVLATTGCGGDPGVEVTPPADTGPTDDLAPSQRTAATAPRPSTPPPCDPELVSVWTAHVGVADGWIEPVLRIRNDGAAWCEVDVGDSPQVDPLMEPDVWLEPGAWADLVVGSRGDGCDGVAAVRLVDVAVNGASVRVETPTIEPCAWQLTAFYPNEVSDVPCDGLHLDAVAVEGAVLVRNGGASTCRLGMLTAVEGDEVEVVAGDVDVAVPLLAPADVVAIATERRGDGPSTRPIVLRFDSGVVLEIAVAGDVASVAAGPGGPWIGGPGSPVTGDPLVLPAALDPFGDES